jgi:type VI secretion system protein ImpJ
MSGNNRTVWSEGMFLRPQHFQQNDRYFETLIRERCGGLHPYDWGVKEIKIDQKQLSLGKFTLEKCSGIFPDGTPFNLPDYDELPLPIEIPIDVQNSIIYLALPTQSIGAIDVDSSGLSNFSRYRAVENEVRDCNVSNNETSPVVIAKLQTRLMLEKQERGGYVYIGIARVIESRVDKTIILDEQYIPATVNSNALPILNGFIKELSGILHSRGEQLGVRVSEAGHGGIAEISDFMLLQLVNRVEPLFEHLQTLPNLHPENLYRVILQLAGELATFYKKQKRTASFEPYQHDDLQKTFRQVIEEIRQLFSLVLEQNAILIPLVGPKHGIYAARLPDINLLNNSMFVLAVNANIPAKQLLDNFPSLVKISPVEHIQNLVRQALGGIVIDALPVAPRQIPFHTGFVYFELNKQGDLWKFMAQSAGFAIHIAGELPALELEFWAIKNG